MEIYQYNETILQSKREISKLQMDITDKNTTIYNLYKKIECLEQALTISKQRMNAQLDEIEVSNCTSISLITHSLFEKKGPSIEQIRD